VLSPIDGAVHQLMVSSVPGVLGARCGHLLPPTVIQHGDPPQGYACESCRVLFIADPHGNEVCVQRRRG
jgi:hypothetical protein